MRNECVGGEGVCVWEERTSVRGGCVCVGGEDECEGRVCVCG